MYVDGGVRPARLLHPGVLAALDDHPSNVTVVGVGDTGGDAECTGLKSLGLLAVVAGRTASISIDQLLRTFGAVAAGGRPKPGNKARLMDAASLIYYGQRAAPARRGRPACSAK